MGYFAANYFGGGAGYLEIVDILDQIAAKTDLITSDTGAEVGGTNSRVYSYIGETHIKTLPSGDYTELTLEVAFEEERAGGRKADIASVADGSITRTTTTIAFAIPAEVALKVRDLTYSVRDTDTGEVLINGAWEVRHSPLI